MVFIRQKKTLILISALIIAIAIIAQYIIVSRTPHVIEEKIYDIKAEIGEKVGVLIDAETIDFGRVPQDGASQKELTIGNSHDEDVKVVITVFGEVKDKDMIIVSPNNFILKPGESKVVYVQFNSGFNESKVYTGQLKVSMVS